MGVNAMSIVGTVREVWRYPVKSMAGEKLAGCDVGPSGIRGDRLWATRDDKVGEIRGARRMPVLLQCSARFREEPANGNTPHVEITLPDGTRVGSDDANVSARLSALVERPVTLWPVQPATDRAHYRRAQPGAALIGKLTRTQRARRILLDVMRWTGMDADLREELSREKGEAMPDLSINPGVVFEFTTPPGTYFDAFPLHLLTTASLDAMKQANPAAEWDARRFRPNFLIETDLGLRGLVENDWNGRTLAIGSLRLRCEIPTVRCGMTTHAQQELPKDPSVLRSIVRDAGQNLGVYASIVTPGRVNAGDPVELV